MKKYKKRRVYLTAKSSCSLCIIAMAVLRVSSQSILCLSASSAHVCVCVCGWCGCVWVVWVVEGIQMTIAGGALVTLQNGMLTEN